MRTSEKHVLNHACRKDGEQATYRSRAHDIHNIYVSLKQWRIFHAVIDCGGFAEAAKTLHLSQSTISYTVAKLQDQLGTPLLKIEGRKAMLTPEGRALLERSRHILKEAIELESYARNLGQGLGGDVRLVVDHKFPTALLMRAINRFSQPRRGAANVKLSEVVMLHVEDVLRDMTVDLAIGDRVPLGFLGEPLIEIEHVPVVHPDHPLAKTECEISATDLAQHTQVIIGHPQNHDRAISNMKHSRWHMSSLDAVADALSECLGYAWLPQHRVKHWLDSGELVRLTLADKRAHKAMLYLIHGRPWAASPAAARLAEVLRSLSLTSGQEEPNACSGA